MAHRPMRVAHLVTHPVQYFAPLYRALAARPEIDLTVYFYSDISVRAFHDREFDASVQWDTSLLDGYRSRFLPSARSWDVYGGPVQRPHLDILREVDKRRFDVVWAHGYAHPTTWLAVLAARARGVRVLIREEQTLLHSRPWRTRAMKEVALRALFSQVSGLYIGEQNRRYFRHYGMPETRLFPARYCVDNADFQARAAALSPQREDLRRSFGIIDDAPVVLFCGKLTEKKQPLRLIEAFARVRRRSLAWLLIAGDGPLRAEAGAQVARLDVPGVRFAGFLNQSEMPHAYAAADLFVLPSAFHETWGLVVNEAMNFSLPVIVSDKVGCGADLVCEGRNGFVVPHADADALADRIAALIGDAAMRREFGARSRRVIDGYSIDACADGIVAACTEGVRRDAA